MDIYQNMDFQCQQFLGYTQWPVYSNVTCKFSTSSQGLTVRISIHLRNNRKFVRLGSDPTGHPNLFRGALAL